MNNYFLNRAKKQKDDEFYTQMVDIEKEMCHYETHFKNKIVYCNCDDYRVSNFWKYFYNKFQELGLKKLISTCFSSCGRGVKAEYDGVNVVETQLIGDGDFRSQECIDTLKSVDVVVTNPPFSLFREYIQMLLQCDKKFIAMCGTNAFSYKPVFPKIKDDKVWAGYNSGAMSFVVPYDSQPRISRFWIDEQGVKWRSLGVVSWLTNLEHDGRNKTLNLKETFSPEKYPKYDNYNAVEVSKVADIPKDYDGVMGVPITFLMKYNPNQFEIVGASEDMASGFSNGLYIQSENKNPHPVLNGVSKYSRVFIKHRKV